MLVRDPLRAVRLRRVLDHRQAERAEVGRGAAEEVHRHDRLRLVRDLALDLRRIEVQRRRVDVGENRCRAAPGDRLGGRVERERRADHLVAGADVHPVEHEDDRVGAVGAADRLLDAELGRSLALEGLDLGAEDELPGVERARERVLQLRDQRRVLRLDIDVGDRHQPDCIVAVRLRRRTSQYATSATIPATTAIST